MRSTALLLLLVAVVSGLFSFGFIDGIRWGPAQLLCGVSLVLFVLSAMAGFTPSVQVRPSKRDSTMGQAVYAAPSGSRFALIYLTVGGLGLIWCGIWYWYLSSHPPLTDTVWYWCYGCLLSSLGALILGLAIGRRLLFGPAVEVPPEDKVPASIGTPGALTEQGPFYASGPPLPQS
jgi:uncharacterized membrane protein YtjA (UPF0391 family)